MTVTRITITVDKDIVAEAKGLGINISGAATKGIAAATEREKKMREIYPHTN